MTATALPVTVPAPNDLVAAWPQQPQQLFILLHAAGQKPAQMLPMAQRLAGAFANGIVACVAAPHQYDDGAGFQWYSQRGEDDSNRMQRLLPARDELLALVAAWQQHTGLDASRTAIVALGQSATVALEAVAHSPALAARLFAIGGRFGELPPGMHQHTSIHWLHGKQDEHMPYQAAVEAGYHLRGLDADFTVDVYPDAGHTITAEMQERILHLLQNHIPLRVWREATAQAGQAAPPDPTVH